MNCQPLEFFYQETQLSKIVELQVSGEKRFLVEQRSINLKILEERILVS